MKATLIREAVFTLEVDGVKFPGMRVESRWEGLTKLVNEKKESLIVSGEESECECIFDTWFGGIFRDAQQTREAGVIIVMGSPSLLHQIATAQHSTTTDSPTTN
jgi:hypothetical protein